MSYTVKRGDTMSKIAERNGVSLSALEKANPNVKNDNVISVGEKLNIPGQSDSFSSPTSKPSTPAAAPKPTSTVSSSGGGGRASKASAAVDQAKSYLGRYETDLQAHGITQKCPTGESCANFVTSMLHKTGAIDFRTLSVADLNKKLRAEGWHVVSAKDAKPGDVWICNGAHGESHTELVSSNTNGKVTLIGSNNHPRPGNQQINYDSSSAGLSGSFILAPPGS